MLALAVFGLKGGIGKSLVAREVASALHGAGHRVLLVDADAPQETCRKWALAAAEADRDGPPVVSVDGASLRRYLDGCAASYDVAVIDTARLEKEGRAALLVADLVLLPVIPGKESLDALDMTAAVVTEAQERRPELRVGAVLNLWTRTKVAKLTRDAVKARGLAILAELPDRTSRRQAMALGLGSMALAKIGRLEARELGLGSPKARTRAAEEVETMVQAALEAAGGKKRWQRRKTRG